MYEISKAASNSAAYSERQEAAYRATLPPVPTSLSLLKGAKVVKVHDGDTITVSHPSHKTNLILRIAEIDAPELQAFTWPTQPFGPEAHAATAAFLSANVCDVHLAKFDPRTSRWIAHVTTPAGDLSHYLVTNGFAWSYIPDKKSSIPGLMAAAQKAKVGLWAATDPAPMAPSDWRKNVKRPAT